MNISTTYSDISKPDIDAANTTNCIHEPTRASPTTNTSLLPAVNISQNTSVSSLPPPLIPVSHGVTAQVLPMSHIQINQQPTNPYFMKFLPKQIRICQSCHSGYQHGLNGEPLPPPYDIIIGHFERQQYSDQVTGLTQLSGETCVHYHAFPQCILAKFPDFQPTELSIPTEVFMKLNATHKLFLNSTFGTRL